MQCTVVVNYLYMDSAYVWRTYDSAHILINLLYSVSEDFQTV